MANENKLIIVIVLAAFVAGLAGAAAGKLIPVPEIKRESQEITVEQSSAITKAVEQVNPSVVSILVTESVVDIFGRRRSKESQGTGFFVADNLIMTNRHVASSSSAKYTVFTEEGEEIEAQFAASDPLNDLAILKVDGKFAPLTLGDSGKVKVGQTVIAFGNALGQYQNSVTSGIISGIGREITAEGASGTERLDGVIQTDAAINPGNSGGPLVDLAGAVIGVNTAVDRSGQLIGFALPINLGKSALKQYLEKGKIERPLLGVRYIPINKQVQAQYDLPVARGAYLLDSTNQPAVVPGGPADKAGLKSGDIMTKVAGAEITEKRSLLELIQEHSVGEKVELTVIRSGETFNVEVTLGSVN